MHYWDTLGDDFLNVVTMATRNWHEPLVLACASVGWLSLLCVKCFMSISSYNVMCCKNP